MVLSRRIKTVIIGAGQIAAGYDSPNSAEILTHANAVRSTDEFELVGFYDVDRSIAQKAAKKWNVRPIDDLSAIEDIDVVCCAVPDAFHYEVMKRVSKWSDVKAVICEKPLADSYEKACDIRDIYDLLQVPVFVNYSRRFLSEFSDLKEWIDKKAGSFVAGHCVYGKGITHNCSHMINLLLYLFGSISVGNIFGIINDYNDNDPSVDFDLLNGLEKIYFQTVPCDVATVFEMDLFFENGRVKYDDAEARIDYYTIRDSAVFPGYRNYYYERSVKINRSQAMQLLYRNVYEVINGSSDIILSNIRDSVKTLEICKEIVNKANGWKP